MREIKLIIKGEFPTLNEIIKASKSHYMQYANQKKEYTSLATMQTRNTKPIKNKADWLFTWYRRNKQTDPDNIQVGTKYIFDSLVGSKIIQNDGWGQINSITHKFKVDKEKPRVEIEVKELE